MVPATVDVGELKGFLAPAKRRASLADMDNAIRDGAAARVRQSDENGRIRTRVS
jgi:hypothetical protein